LAYPNALSAYRETSIRTASQGQLIILLYDEAVKQLDRSLELMNRNMQGKRDPGNIENINKAIVKAQEIITELTVSLDFEKGAEIASNLFSLYNWFNRELLEANITGDSERIRTVRTMIDDLRSAWNEVVAKTSADGVARPSAGVNIAG